MRKLFLFIAALLTVGAMAQSDPLAAYSSQKNIDYVGDGHIGHKLDIYYPNDEQAIHPVIIHIYGSAWSNNNMKGSADLKTVGVAALEAGYIFVAPNHRSASDAIFPAQINDIKAVVRYLRGNAQTLGIDASFIAVSGFSSGGHLAALMGVTGNVSMCTVGSETIDVKGDIGNYTDQSSSVDAACSWSGFVELRNQSGCNIQDNIVPFIESLMGCTYESKPDKWALASVNTYVAATNAPTILFHGSGDLLCPACVSENFYNNLRGVGVDCEYEYHSGNHAVNADYTDEMIAFFNRIKLAKQTEGLHHVAADAKAEKILRDGQLYILRGEKTYTLQGQEIQ